MNHSEMLDMTEEIDAGNDVEAHILPR